MSWENALRDADNWLQTLSLPKPLKGKFINLDDHADTLKIDGNYRVIVLRAAKRLLEKRGADVHFTEPPWSPSALDE
jgi:hypothetical protein